ncbi:hypothetical protein ARMGADRAFT_1017318 [Armillaria gallica]|uniref:Uncharacterized protein n=1 Tax=Armillaria gallica TaxID=47427 RepID=A0A2H3CU97_ARMGA|nr:hypothetical protein ARMGADRAFT_1017318 [Armillaria gallica]
MQVGVSSVGFFVVVHAKAFDDDSRSVSRRQCSSLSATPGIVLYVEHDAKIRVIMMEMEQMEIRRSRKREPSDRSRDLPLLSFTLLLCPRMSF